MTQLLSFRSSWESIAHGIRNELSPSERVHDVSIMRNRNGFRPRGQGTDEAMGEKREAWM